MMCFRFGSGTPSFWIDMSVFCSDPHVLGLGPHTHKCVVVYGLEGVCTYLGRYLQVLFTK